MKNTSDFLVDEFGSGFAVYQNGIRMTPALDEKVAKQKMAKMMFADAGFQLIYNPDNKPDNELYTHFVKYKKPCLIVTVEVEGEKLQFVK